MVLLLITVVVGVVVGLATFGAARLWRVDLGAPKVDPTTVADEVRRHGRAAQWLRRRTDPTAVTGSLLTAAVLVIIIGAGGLGVLLMMVRTHRGFADFDLAAARFGARHATALSTRGLRVMTQFGGAAVLVPIAVVFAAVQYRRLRRWSVVWFVLVVVAGQYVLADTIKAVVDRTRPDISRLTGFSGPSFPSGHATASAAVFAAFALVLGMGRSRSTKRALIGGAAGLAAMIAASRVFLGVHWLTDVLAGLCLGWAWFALSSVAFGGRLLRFGAPVQVAEEVASNEPASHEPAAEEPAAGEMQHS